jgi:Arc/MetJ family transcription regulator
MSRVLELKTHYGEEQAKLLNELFDLPAKARGVDVNMRDEVKESLGPKELNAVKAAEGVIFAEAERERLKAKYLELDLELRAAIEVRIEEIELELSPKNVGFRDYAAAAEASPETLITAMDMALDGGDENAALLAFQAGRRRELDEVTSHAITVNEEWGELYAELSEAANDLGLDPGDRWETLAPPAPSKFDILNAPQSDINFYGSLR